MNYEFKRGYWETKEHKILKIKDMETSHIENVIKYLKEHPEFYDEEYGNFGFDVDDFDYFHIDNSQLVDEKIQELEYELKIRESESEVK